MSPADQAGVSATRRGDGAPTPSPTPSSTPTSPSTSTPTTPCTESSPQRRMADDVEAKALASRLRLRILRLCLDEPLSNREIAEALGKHPATVLHHVRTLADAGFLQAQEVRRGRRGAREIPYLATGKSWWVQAPASAGKVLGAFLDEIDQVPPEQHDLTRLGLRLPPAEMQEFRARLRALLEEFAARPRDPEADPWSLFVALHPDPTAPVQGVTRRHGATPGPNQC